MKHKVPWNRTLLEDFIKEGLLTEDEEFIMRNVIEDNPIGTYLITMNGHITVAIDGIIYDTFDCRNRIVRDVWIVNRD